MSRKVFGYGVVGLLVVALIAGTVYILVRPVEAQAGRELSDNQAQRADSGQPVALQAGNGRRGGGSAAPGESDGDRASVGQGAGRGASAAADAAQGSGRGQGRVQGQGAGTGTGTGAGGAMGAVDWETVTGQVIVADSEMVVQTAGGEVIVGLGQVWYREEAGFVLSVGDDVSVTGFYEDGEFKAGTVENLTTGQTLVLRDEDGRPMWAGGGERQNQRQTPGQTPGGDAGNDRGGGRGNGAGSSPVTGELDEASQAALVEALEEEYRALATYEAIMDQFGAAQPFASIARSEERHAEALVALFDLYGLDVPAAPEFEAAEFDSLQDACAAGVQAEIADAALYDRLFEVVTAPDVVRVFTNLQNASLNNHLPAFEACAE